MKSLLPTTLALSLLLSMTALAAANPPACLLSAINTQPNDPSDLASICGTSSTVSSIQSYIYDNCPDSTARDAAMEAFKDTCQSEANVSVASYTPTATTSGARQTGDDGARSTNTASAISSGAGAQQTGDSGAAQVGGSNGWWMAVVVGAVGLAGAL